MIVRVQEQDFDSAAEIEVLVAGLTDVGAVVTFTGLVRGEKGTGMELECYPEMAVSEIENIAKEARTRWPVANALVIHRYGKLRVGERIVLVATLAEHRADAFEATEFLIDWLKTKAPFWKRESAAGDRPDAGTWVEAKSSDDARAARWKEK